MRGSSSAARLLSGRLARLTALTSVVILTASGEPLGVETGLGQVLDVILAAYSVIVFATLAGSIGAYFLRDRSSRDGRDPEK